MKTNDKPTFVAADGQDFFRVAFLAWLAIPDADLTEEELIRPVYDARGKLLARHRRDWNGNLVQS